MEENPPRISGQNPTRKATKSGSNQLREEKVGSVDCTGKSCRSCAATLIADCVGVCCCPLALVSLFALAFVKVPYLVGKKCLKRRITERKRQKIAEANSTMTTKRSSKEKSDIVFEIGEVEGEELEERKSFCASFEAEKVLFELYQVGHLGFGRVSFGKSFDQPS